MLLLLVTIAALVLSGTSAKPPIGKMDKPEKLSINKKIENAAELSRLAGENPVPDDSVLVELDMLFTKERWAERKESIPNEEADGHRRNAIRDERYRWTDNTIPYAFQPDTFTEEEMRQIMLGIDGWNKYTCLNLRPATPNDYNYIYIESRGGCTAYVGMIGGGQMVNLGPGCRTVDIVLHELGHAIGLEHEQCRTDRDDYITVHLENVYEEYKFAFNRYSEQYLNMYGILYDYRSIMHYDQSAFSMNGYSTITTKDPYFQSLIGRYPHLSFRDIRIVNNMYHCDAHCSPKTCPGEGFVGEDCQCWCPGNPIQLCGDHNPEVPEDRECVDYDPDCPYFADWGYCDDPDYQEWMEYYCPASCRLCNPDCVDYEGNCDYYSHMGWCDSERDYMSSYCPKSCRFCNP